MSIKLKKQLNIYLKRWKKSGKKITSYICQHCKEKIKTPQPDKNLVDKKGFWDSATICSECERMNFVTVYPSGKTVAFKLGK